MNAPTKPFDDVGRLARESEAAKALRTQLAAIAEGDEDFLRDAVEGETSVREIIARLVANEAEDAALVSGIGILIADLGARKKRVEERIEYRRAMMANGLTISGLEKLETPGGTVSIKAIPVKLIVGDDSAIPSKYWTPAAPTLDRKMLLADLKALAPGATPIPGAALSNGGQTIAIRR